MKRLLTACMLLLCLTACFAKGAADEEVPQLLEVGTPAPDLTLYTAAAPKGFTLSTLRGKYVVMEFWATWCPDCRKVTDAMKTLFATYGSDEIVFLGISFDTSPDAWQAYIAAHDLSWQQHREEVMWKENAAAAMYNVQWIPTFYIIAPDGTIAYGTIDIASLGEKLCSLAAQE